MGFRIQGFGLMQNLCLLDECFSILMLRMASTFTGAVLSIYCYKRFAGFCY